MASLGPLQGCNHNIQPGRIPFLELGVLYQAHMLGRRQFLAEVGLRFSSSS